MVRRRSKTVANRHDRNRHDRSVCGCIRKKIVLLLDLGGIGLKTGVMGVLL